MLYELIASSEQRQRSNRWRAYDVIRRKGQQHMTMSDERRGHQSTAYKKGGLLYDMTCVRGTARRRMEQWTFWLLQKKNRGGLAEREWMKVRWEWEDDDDAMSVEAAAQINWCKTSYLLYSTSTVYNRSVCARTCLTSKRKLKKAWMYDF